MITEVLRTTLDAFASGGWDAVRIDAIAEQAGVHKTTIYRRWPTRGALLAAALIATPFHPPAVAAPDTGTLRGDLLAITGTLERSLQVPRTRRITRNLMQAGHEPEIAAAVDEFWASRVQLAAGIIRAAKERGEVEDDVDPDLVATLLLGAVKLHLIDLDNNPPHEWYLELVDATLRASGAL